MDLSVGERVMGARLVPHPHSGEKARVLLVLLTQSRVLVHTLSGV